MTQQPTPALGSGGGGGGATPDPTSAAPTPEGMAGAGGEPGSPEGTGTAEPTPAPSTGSVMGGKENNFTPLPAIPDGTNGPSNKMLPDPFKFMDGTRITSKADWEKLRADLSAMIQAAVYGPKMPAPDTLDATFSGGKVTVNMTVGGKNGSFSFSISGGGTADSPKPCVIICGGGTMPSVPFPDSVARIGLDNATFAGDSAGVYPPPGLVKDLYGDAAAKSGSDICWAWGASRIIDALEKVPEAGIDTTRIATTGCSFAGKGALAMGVFDERVALTVMQEGGSGGSALWRVSTAEAAQGQNIQEATEICDEKNWEGKDFHTLFSKKDKKTAPVDMLIADQHFAVAIAAPRAILLIENDIDWLGPVAAYGGGVSGRKVYEALGIADRCGVSVAANHGHCQFPGSQQAAVTAFINRFLLGMDADTSGVDELNATNSKLKTFKEADFIDWDVPTLDGDLPWDPFA
ncbi:MAG TPA: hypothetical protein VHM70_32700 [Polyangiaceae bacterium]|jgi:hypothetical protein|nr:hypothetical protein [Polyangiaceae bacterium]